MKFELLALENEAVSPVVTTINNEPVTKKDSAFTPVDNALSPVVTTVTAKKNIHGTRECVVWDLFEVDAKPENAITEKNPHTHDVLSTPICYLPVTPVTPVTSVMPTGVNPVNFGQVRAVTNTGDSGDTGDKQNLPSHLEVSAIPFYSTAWYTWLHLRSIYRVAMGKDADGYYIRAVSA